MRALWILLVPVVASALGCATLEELLDDRRWKGLRRNGEQWGYWEYFHDDGTKSAEGKYAANRQVGPWTYWYSNGAKSWEGSFNNGKLDGASRYTTSRSELVAEGYFHNGLEQGNWTFWSAGGVLDQEGYYDSGVPTLQWTYFYPNGNLKSEGYRLDGKMVGVWKFWDMAGTLTERSFPFPEGYGLVREEWPDGTVRREGFTMQGQQVGLWVTWHKSGTRRTLGRYASGVPSGRWVSWNAEGAPLAAGNLERGRAVDKWQAWSAGETRTVFAERFPRPEFQGTFSGDAIPAGEKPEVTAARWIGESTERHPETSLREPRMSAPDAADGAVAAVSARPRIPFRAQPWTVDEAENLDVLVAIYSDGGKRAPKPKGGTYRRPQTRETFDGDSGPLVGMTLPAAKLFLPDGTEMGLEAMKRKPTVILIMRGYGDEGVCVYCATQAYSYQNPEAKKAFEDCDAELVIVYPGSAGRLAAFLDSYSRQWDLDKLWATVTYDAELDLVDALDIRADLAKPTALIVDADGQVRWAYVGKGLKDRPPVETVVKELSRIVGEAGQQEG